MTSLAYDFLLLCWQENRLTDSQIDYAVSQGWITPEEAETIKATPKH